MDINKDKHVWVMTIVMGHEQEKAILKYCELMAKAVELGIDKDDCGMRWWEEFHT